MGKEELRYTKKEDKPFTIIGKYLFITPFEGTTRVDLEKIDRIQSYSYKDDTGTKNYIISLYREDLTTDLGYMSMIDIRINDYFNEDTPEKTLEDYTRQTTSLIIEEWKKIQ